MLCGLERRELLKSHLNGTIQPIRTLMEMAAEELERIKIKSAATTSNGSIKLAMFKNKCLKEYLMSIGREDMSLAAICQLQTIQGVCGYWYLPRTWPQSLASRCPPHECNLVSLGRCEYGECFQDDGTLQH